MISKDRETSVDQRLHEQRALHLGKDADEDAAEHRNDRELIEVHDIGKDALEDLAGVFHLGARAAVAAGAHQLSLLCHYASPRICLSRA